MNAVEAHHVEKRFGRVRALAGLSLAIESGTIALLRGPNGAGKSTLLRVVAALTRPTRGEIRVLGRDLFRGESAPLRARIGYLGPEPALYGELSVRENLAFCARLRGAPAAAIEEQLEAHGLGDVAERRAGALSTGFRRRAGLARTLLGEPELLLLDEPWNGLDATAAGLLVDALGALRVRGATALVAAHAADAYLELFDYGLEIQGGKVAAPEAA